MPLNLTFLLQAMHTYSQHPWRYAMTCVLAHAFMRRQYVFGQSLIELQGDLMLKHP